METLPEELLEYIMSFLSPYSDLEVCMFVCKKWNRVANGVVTVTKGSLCKSLDVDCSLDCLMIRAGPGPTITERFSHCSCYYQKSMFIFGGCTASCTTFNDLWRFDLETRKWIRPLATGSYPSPKASSSLVVYKDSLVLFGGYSPPGQFPYYQSSLFSNNIHVYATNTNKWTAINTPPLASPKPMAGHSATVIGKNMIMFGGCQGVSCFNDVWILDLEQFKWCRIPTSEVQPLPRYNHSHILLDEHHLLIIGGCGGPNKIYSDVWLLTMGPELPWQWTELVVKNPDSAAPKLWSHQACKVGNKAVVFSKGAKPKPSDTSGSPWKKRSKLWIPAPRSQSPTQRGEVSMQWSSETSSDDDVRSTTSSSHSFASSNSDSSDKTMLSSDDNASFGSSSSPGCSHWQDRINSGLHDTPSQDFSNNKSFKVPKIPCKSVQEKRSIVTTSQENVTSRGQPSIRPNAMCNRERQLENLRKMEERIRTRAANLRERVMSTNKQPATQADKSHLREFKNNMQVYVLDVSTAVSDGTVSWQPNTENLCNNLPEEMAFYTVVMGRGELVIFGGIHMDTNRMSRNIEITQEIVSNCVYILRSSLPFI